MIRAFEKSDIERVAGIWLETNMEAHRFVPAQYWKENFEMVRGLLMQAQIYVYEEEKANRILGFIGLNGGYIEGIFVLSEMQSRGIGKQLLDFVKRMKTQLSLSVYEKNAGAVKFYQREGFKIRSEGIDTDTGEKEYTMMWKQ